MSDEARTAEKANSERPIVINLQLDLGNAGYVAPELLESMRRPDGTNCACQCGSKSGGGSGS